MAERVHGTACRACGNRAHNTTLRAREIMVGRRDTFDYVRCAECGALSLVVVPEHLGDFYPTECYSFDAPAVEMRRPFVAAARRAARPSSSVCRRRSSTGSSPPAGLRFSTTGLRGWVSALRLGSSTSGVGAEACSRTSPARASRCFSASTHTSMTRERRAPWCFAGSNATTSRVAAPAHVQPLTRGRPYGRGGIRPGRHRGCCVRSNVRIAYVILAHQLRSNSSASSGG